MSEKYSVLVVDDDINIGHLIKLYLEKEGYQVTIATRGDDAVEMFNDAFNLVILDIMLPGLDGWDVCRAIRKTSELPIIMLTAKRRNIR